jgi:23S rRNA (guanosine2251-2'-O)-methyltransferase
VLHATNLRIPIVEVEGGSLTALAGFDGHQGVALVVEPRQFASLDDVLARAAERDEPPFILVLDSLEDPHNVGTLLRSAEAAGVHGVVFPTHRQAPLSPSAVKASAGAIEHLLLCPVDDLPGALSDLHSRGVRVAGAEGDAPMTARQSDLRGPLAIVVGSEGQGLGPAVRRRCDLFMRIPMKGAVGSLNAAVAGSILLFEALAQRDPNATPRVEPAFGGFREQESTPAETTPKRRGRKGPTTEAEGEQAGGAGDGDSAAAARTTRQRRAPKGLTTQPEEVLADAGGSAEPAVKRQPREVSRAEPDGAAPAGSDAASDAHGAGTTPKRRSRKSASPEPDPAPAMGSDDAAPATVEPKAKRRGPRTSEPATSPAPATGSPEEDLLPGDGAKKRSSGDR